MKRRLTEGVLILAYCTFAAACAHAEPRWQEAPEIGELFREAGVRGTFVVYDEERDLLTGFDEARARERFVPASTFKIPNTLIGLSAGSVASVDEVLPYGGGPQFLKAWEQDMSLRDAIVVSNVPVYRELARRTGLETMRASVRKLNYGNAEIGDRVDRFWLEGPLRVSAVEQAFFLNDLARGRLPFPAQAQADTREITLLESGPGWELHGKTGLLMDGDVEGDPAIGWWVGWVVKDGRVHAFALNLAVRRPDDKDRRVPLGKSALKALRILD